MTMIAVTGATGQLGRITIEQLKAKLPAEHIIGLVRNVEKAKDLGVTVRQADYDQIDTLFTALQGVDKLYLISSSEVGKRLVQHKNVIEAAKKVGVKQIVYTSLLRADSSSLSLAEEHKQTEEVLKQSGVAYTILRNGWYTENYTEGLPVALEIGSIYGATGEGKISSASRADYAEAAISVLLGNGHENKTYELAGDNAYTLADLAQTVSQQVGKQIPYVNLSEEGYTDVLKQAGLGDFAPVVARWDIDAKNGALYSEDKTLSQLLGRPTTTMSEVVKAALSSLR